MLQQLSLRVKVTHDRLLAAVTEAGMPHGRIQEILSSLEGPAR